MKYSNCTKAVVTGLAYLSSSAAAGVETRSSPIERHNHNELALNSSAAVSQERLAGGKRSVPMMSGPAWNFPPKETWADLETLVSKNSPDMRSYGDTESDVSGILIAVHEASQQFGIDPRAIFAIIMQESGGNVGAPTMDEGRSKGLMQAFESTAHVGEHNLSQEDITGMVLAGTGHFRGSLDVVGGGDDAQTVYKALRIYNSGNLGNPNDLSDGVGATNTYVSDVAHRLQGKTNGEIY